MDTENDTGGGAMGEEEALEMEDFSVALDQQQVSRFLINRELDCTDCAEKPRSSYSVSRPATSRDLIWSAGSDAYKLSVEDPIPEKFENIHQYLKRSFALPMLEELREGLGAALDPAQLNLQQAEAARLHSFQAAKDSKMMGLPPKPAWFKVASSEILLVLTPTGQPCKAARWAPGQMCLLYEEGALQDALALGGGDESADRAPAVQAKPGGCCRFGMIHTTPKSKHALVLVSQRKDLPKVTEREERRVRYQNARDRRADVEVQKAQLRVAQAMADPEGHQPIFWQREISGQPDHAASAFGRMAEQKCQAMGEEEFTLEAALNESQEQAVRKLVRCSHGVQLVQGPPGTGKTHTLSVLLHQCALLALGSSSVGTPAALGDVPSEQPPEPRDASGDDGNERSQKGAQQANRCLVCAPTNIAVQELLLRLLDRLEPSLRSQVALVATEERANVAWGEEVSPASSVLLDHRKKRVKRVARFWLGEGYDTRRQPKPFLRQVPWLWRCASPVAALLSEPGLAFGQCHAAGGSGTEVLCFVRQQLAELRAIILGQLDRLEQEVAFKAREFEPSFASKKETEERGAEGSIFSKLEALRNCLQHLAQLLQATLALWRVQRPPAGAAFASSEPPPSAGAGSAEPGAAAPEGGQYSFSMAERQRAYECVIWAAEDRKRLEELAELLSLEALPPAGRGQAAREAQEEATQKFAKAAKKLRVLVHPDKAHPEMKDMACLASQHIDPALAALRQHLKFREAKGQPTVPRAPQETSFPAGKVVLHELLSCLDAATQKKLEEVLEVHQELQTACLMVRTCRSDKLKSALLRRCALAGAPGGGGSLVGRKPYLE
ncbi:unnamed protein product [Effrenium voratum]|nr:unnamed protein product [Effrenium voratum]